MPIEEDITIFKDWAINLGIPLSKIPNDDALKSKFKSPQQGDIFRNLIKKIHPRQDVARIRENILIMKMSKLKDQVSVCSRSFLPKEMQIYLKIQDLKKRIAEKEMTINNYGKEYESISSSIKMKNMQCIKKRKKQEHLIAKINLLQVKTQELMQSVESEKKLNERIVINTPVKLNSTNSNQNIASEAIEEAVKKLNMFYESYGETHNMQDAKNELWNKLRQILSNIPNCLLYNSILRMKENQLQNIMDLSTTNVAESHLSKGADRNHLTAFEIKLMKSKLELIVLAAKYLNAQKECEHLNERFSAGYDRFVEDVQLKVGFFNTKNVNDIDEIISDYVVQYNTHSFNNGQNKYIAEQIDKYKQLIETDSRQLEDHEMMLVSIRQAYSEINNSINRIQIEKNQLGYIKEKIIYSRNLLQCMLDDFQTTVIGARPSQMLSKAGVDSFEIADSLFSSTKLDLDSTALSISRRDFSHQDDTGQTPVRSNIPAYASEIHIFNEISIENFDCINNDCAFYLSPNPLITESQELSSTVQMAPGILLTANGALNELYNRLQMAEAIKSISFEMHFKHDLVTADPIALKAKAKEQYEIISELFDQIDVVSIKTQHILNKASKYYDFIKRNILKNYIPHSKKFNSQTYDDYESEFLMYYHIASDEKAVE